MQRLSDKLLTHIGAVGVSGIDEVDTDLDGSPQDRSRLVPIRRIAPYSPTGDAHRPEAEAVDRHVATDVDRSSVGRRDWRWSGHGNSFH
jgi:hypothetical protein